MTPEDLAIVFNSRRAHFSVLAANPTGNGQRRSPRLRLQITGLDGAFAQALASNIEGAHPRCRDRDRDHWLVEVRGPRVEEIGTSVVDLLNERVVSSFTAALNLIEEIRARRVGAL